MDNEDEERLEKYIQADNVEKLSNFLDSNEHLRKQFNTFQYYPFFINLPLLHFAVQRKSQKVVEYLLSQDFVDKSVCNTNGENIYHVICGIRDADELFSIIERNVPHHLLLDNNSVFERNAFHIACHSNNIFIVKRMLEILESLKVDLTSIKKPAMDYAIKNIDNDVIKYVSLIDGIQFNDCVILEAIRSLKFDIVVYLLNDYLCQSIPSHLHNQFHIFQFSNLHPDQHHNNNNNDNIYARLVEENYKKIIAMKGEKECRIWHEVCLNANLDVVQLIFSLKGIQPEILNEEGYNPFLFACHRNSNIKVIKKIHKLFPSLIHTQIDIKFAIVNGAFLIFYNYDIKTKLKFKILHYLYMNGIDIHFLSMKISARNQITYESLYTSKTDIGVSGYDWEMVQYIKVISQDFDYINNEHDDNVYRKPSFWKEIDDCDIADDQSKHVNEWKNRFDEHVLHNLSKMIQQHMLQREILIGDYD